MLPSTSSTHSMRRAPATSWSRQRARRRSATPCWIHPSHSRPGCIDHDTDAYEKIARAFVDGQPSGNLTREHIVDNITLYWLTGTGASAARSYWEEGADGCSRSRPGSHAGLGPGRLHHVPRGDLADPAQLGREGLPRPSSTSTRSTRAAISPRGKSRSCSARRFARRSGRFAGTSITRPSDGGTAWPTTAGTPIRREAWPRRAALASPFDRPSAGGRLSRPARRGSPAGVRRGDRLAQLGATDPGGSPRAGRPRRLLDLHLHQLAAHPALPASMGTRSTPTSA